MDTAARTDNVGTRQGMSFCERAESRQSLLRRRVRFSRAGVEVEPESADKKNIGSAP